MSLLHLQASRRAPQRTQPLRRDGCVSVLTGRVPPRGPADALLARIAVGETAAFDELYGQFQSRVFGLCLQLIRDRHQAQEVTQEVFLQIWRLATFP